LSFKVIDGQPAKLMFVNRKRDILWFLPDVTKIEITNVSSVLFGVLQNATIIILTNVCLELSGWCIIVERFKQSFII
jgi:hypothetical protein